MKMQLLFATIILLFSFSQNFAQSKVQNHTDIFIKYKKHYKKVYVYSIHGYVLENFYRVLGSNKGKWDIVDIYPGKTYFGQDSVVKKRCSNCVGADSSIQANEVLNLISEEALTLPCIEKKGANDLYTRPMKNLDIIEDIDYHLLEYRINGCEKLIRYRNPFEALKICPESIERKKFATIINTILFAY